MSSNTTIYKGVTIRYNPYPFSPVADQEGLYEFIFNGVEYSKPSLPACRVLIDALILAQEEADRQTKQDVDEETAEEIEETTEVVEFTAPALPWYAAWLKPVLEFMGALTKNVIDYGTPIFKPISEIAKYIKDLPIATIDKLLSGLPDSYKTIRSGGVEVATKTVDEIIAGESPWVKDLQQGLTDALNPLIKQYFDEVAPDKYESSLVEPEKAVQGLNQWRAGIVGAGLANFIIHALAESGTLGQLEAFKDFDSIVVDKMGLGGVASRVTMQPFEAGLLKQAEKFYNEKYQAELPSQSQLIEMVVKEVMPLEEFKGWMKQKGYNEEWSQNIWDGHFRAPSWGELLQAFYRGEISREELEELKILVDLDPRYDVVWNSLIEVIPPYQELVNQRVKEVLSQEDFEKYLQWQGFDKAWADRIWAAHFIPPSLGDMLTSWRRNEITEEQLDQLMILVDLDPRYKEIFDTRKYDDPSVTMGRFMFETGAIDIPRVTQIVKRQGYHPDDIPRITDFIVRFQERLWRRRYLVTLQGAYQKGIRTKAQLTEEVLAAGYTPGVAHWIIENADLRNEIATTKTPSTKQRLLGLGDIKKAFITDRINDDQLRQDLLLRGYEISDVDLMINLLEDQKITTEAGGRKLALTQAEMVNAWRYGELEEDALRTDLLLRGLALDEINILVNTKKKQWGVAE